MAVTNLKALLTAQALEAQEQEAEKITSLKAKLEEASHRHIKEESLLQAELQVGLVKAFDLTACLF